MSRENETGELSFYRCHFATPVALAALVDVICCRRKIEEDFQLGKSVCRLDQGQTTCWNSWMRWTLISRLAGAVLPVTCLRTTAQATRGRLVPVSTRELLRLLRANVLPSPRRDRGHLLHWSACAANTSTARPKHTVAGTTSPPPRRHDTPAWSRTTAAVSEEPGIRPRQWLPRGPMQWHT